MKRPTEPAKEDCCNSGCNPCIFDVYDNKLKLYEKFLNNSENYMIDFENAISQLDYTTFTVIANIEVCDLHKLLVFKKDHNKIGRVWWNPGDHFLYKYVGESKSCTRAYTPLMLHNKINMGEHFDFMIIVKDYNNKSAVSSHLCALKVGDQTLWRGPYGSYNVIANKFKRIFLIAQGTGIAPFYSIIKKIIENEDDFTNVFLLLCCQNSNKNLLREELYAFNSYWNFTYKIFIGDTNDRSIDNKKYREPIVYHKLTIDDVKYFKPFTSTDQLLLCGSLEFMKSYQCMLQDEGFIMNNIVMF